MVADAAEPLQIAQLPHDSRGYPVPAHVGRVPGQPVRITELDPKRLLLLNGTRHCTICAWRIRNDELCWYHTTPGDAARARTVNWETWEPVIEGAGHEECMIYASVVCPFLAIPDYKRKTAQRGVGGAVLQEKGAARGGLVLIGRPEMEIRLTSATSFDVMLGGGPAVMRDYSHGDELRPVLDALISGATRNRTRKDQELSALLADENENEIAVRATQVTIGVGVRMGLAIDEPLPNEECVCGSPRKYRSCCQARVVHARGLLPLPWRG